MAHHVGSSLCAGHGCVTQTDRGDPDLLRPVFLHIPMSGVALCGCIDMCVPHSYLL